MEVDVLQPVTGPARAILKLYDRRFAAQLRKDQTNDPWTTDRESAYIDFVRSGRAQDFLDKLRNDDNFEEPEEGWDIAENETYLHDLCIDMFKTETIVYTKLRSYQGTRIPRLFAPVTLRIKSLHLENGVDSAPPDSELFQVHGILLGLIPGFTLAQLDEDKAPRTSWQAIVDQAIQTVHILSDHNILNGDIRTSNILITPDADAQGGYRVIMIDFAQCRFRGEDESDLKWGRAKWSQDEEGAIGLVMKARLKKFGFNLKYEGSMRYLECAEGEGDE
jgi:hypothetical protein